jgi:hypothetical protein
MALSPKIPSLYVVPRAVPEKSSRQRITLVPKPPLKLDFAPGPNQYRVDGYGKSLKPLPLKPPPRKNLSLRPVLSLALLCDNMQVPEDDN